MDEQSPAQQARLLITRKDNIEAQLDSLFSILKSNNVNMQSPLVDPEGFPRADIDIYAVRNARVRIIELRNDLKATIDSIAKALEGVYDPNLVVKNDSEPDTNQALKPFAKVESVSPDSPAAEASLERGDLIVKFGKLDQNAFTSGSLQPLAGIVAQNEEKTIPIRVMRSGKIVFLDLTPRKNWGGRGMLGCHIIPYTP